MLVQKRIIRSLVNANYRDHCMPLFKKLNILMLNDTIFLENCKFVFTLLHDVAPIPIRNMFKILDHHHANRGPNVTGVNHTLSAVGQSLLSKPFKDWQGLNKYPLLTNVQCVMYFILRIKHSINQSI